MILSTLNLGNNGTIAYLGHAGFLVSTTFLDSYSAPSQIQHHPSPVIFRLLYKDIVEQMVNSGWGCGLKGYRDFPGPCIIQPY